MPKSKVELAFIEKNSDRNKWFEVRQSNIARKMSELTTLCGVDGCAIIYGPDDQKPPTVWPSVMGAQTVVQRVRERPEMERFGNELDQVSFLYDMMCKDVDALHKERKETREKEMRRVMEEYLWKREQKSLSGNEVDGLSKEDVYDLVYLVIRKQMMVHQRIATIRKMKKNDGAEGKGKEKMESFKINN